MSNIVPINTALVQKLQRFVAAVASENKLLQQRNFNAMLINKEGFMKNITLRGLDEFLDYPAAPKRYVHAPDGGRVVATAIEVIKFRLDHFMSNDEMLVYREIH